VPSSEQSIRIIIDTREQMPYSFESPGIEIIRRALPNGDYSLDGQDYDLAVERKTLEDFVQSVIRNKERFRRELTALQQYRAACIVVEGSLGDIRPGGYTSGAHPNAVFGAATSICVDWGIPVYFCGDRQVARRFVEEWLIRWYGRLQRESAGHPADPRP